MVRCVLPACFRVPLLQEVVSTKLITAQQGQHTVGTVEGAFSDGTQRHPKTQQFHSQLFTQER